MADEDVSSKTASNDTPSTNDVNKNDEKVIKSESTQDEKETERTCVSEEDTKKDKSLDDNMADDASNQSNTSESTPRLSILPVDEGVIERLSNGFLQTFLPQAENSNTILDELMRNQRVLIETLQQENAKFKENKMMSELSELMMEAKKYHSKLLHLKKEMISLHERSTKLKKRALKLQNHKMKQNLQKEQQREREMEQEKHLIAKPATKKTP